MSDEKNNGHNWEDLKVMTWEDLINRASPQDYEIIIKALNDKIKRLKRETEIIKKANKKLNKKAKENSQKIENEYIDIIQIVAVVVAVLGLVLGNILGYIALPPKVNLKELIGSLFIINGIVLMGITFLMFLIKTLFFDQSFKELKSKSIVFIPVGFEIIGLILLLNS